MSRHKRIEARAVRIYTYFLANPDTPFTKTEVCQAIALESGKTTHEAFRRVRVLAEGGGWYFPEAVPAVGCRYILTKDVSKLIDPALHLGRVEAGVREKKKQRIEQIKQNRATLPAGDRPTVTAMLRAEELVSGVADLAQQYIDETAKDLIAARKTDRG